MSNIGFLLCKKQQNEPYNFITIAKHRSSHFDFLNVHFFLSPRNNEAFYGL